MKRDRYEIPEVFSRDEEEGPDLLVSILCFLFVALTFFFVYIFPYLSHYFVFNGF